MYKSSDNDRELKWTEAELRHSYPLVIHGAARLAYERVSPNCGDDDFDQLTPNQKQLWLAAQYEAADFLFKSLASTALRMLLKG